MSKTTSRPSRVSSLFRYVLLGSAALGAASQAAAQEAAPTEEEIVVTGRRPLAESEAAALRVQQQSDSLVSVVSGDAIGNLPDQNIAFAVGRLPGVALERDQGQARYVNLRGLPNRWTTLSFDGLSVVSPEGRSTRFDNIPSAIASQVAVEKAILPSMPGDTVAGNVNVRTRRAFDYNGLEIRGNLGVGYVELGGGEELDASLVVANTFMNERLGVLLQASAYRRNMVTDNWETDPYLTAGAAWAGRPANPNAAPSERYAREYENKPYRLTRENMSASARFDFRIDDANEVFASTIFTTYYDEELRNNYIFRLDQGTATPASVPNFGTVLGANLNVNLNSLESREWMTTNTIGGEHEWGGFEISWRANYTFTEDGRDAPALPNFTSTSGSTNRPTVVYDFRDGADNTVSLFRTTQTGTVLGQGAAVQNIGDFPLTFQNISRRDGGAMTGAYTLKFDVTYPTQLLGRDVELAFGGLWTDRTKTSKEDVFRADAASLTRAGLPQLQPSAFALGRSYLGDYQLGYSFQYHSKSALERIMDLYINTGAALRVDSWQNWWQVNEQIIAAYGMATIDYDWGNIVVGARVEQIETEGRSWITLAGARTRLNVPNEETLFYPSIHFNWNVSEDARVRLSVTQTASRADFNQLRPNFSFSDSARTVSGGNPEALPERQTGVDLYYEYYGDTTFFSFGLFHKEITDVLFNQTDTFGLDVLNTPAVGSTPAIDRSGYAFTTVRNGGGGFVRGAELFYSATFEELAADMGLPAWAGGFGARFSVTYTQSEVEVPAVGSNPARRTRLPGTSDFVYNIQATYEYANLSVRLAYQNRTPWIQSIGSYTLVGGRLVPSGNGDVWWDDDAEIDLAVRYQLNDNIELYFNGENLGDGPGRRYANTSNFPIEYETFGPRYLIGARFDY